MTAGEKRLLLFQVTKKKKKKEERWAGQHNRRHASGFFLFLQGGGEVTFIKPFIRSCDGEPISRDSGDRRGQCSQETRRFPGSTSESVWQCRQCMQCGRAGARVCWRTLNNPEMCCSLSRLTEVRPVEAPHCPKKPLQKTKKKRLLVRHGKSTERQRANWVRQHPPTPI